MEIKILTDVMVRNNAKGEDNRARLREAGVYCVNFTSSPGAGKTTLLTNLIPLVSGAVGVIEGDLYTARDAERLQGLGIPLVQINTEGGCHLNAMQISAAMEDVDLGALDYLFIENVGNLVCPSAFDLGEDIMTLVYSVTEGEDKPMKYSTMFEKADCVLINKCDLAEVCGIDLDALEQEVQTVNPRARIFRIVARDPDTLKPWAEWLHGKRG